jgi:nucleolar protein 9
MPQANKKRGRRSGQKRKHGDGSGRVEGSKRRKSYAAEDEQDFIQLDTNDQSMDAAYPQMEKPFFGMLDEEEQEYFKRADDMLESNTFTDLDERSLFLSNLYREADGKELKIAQSQSCSRLMERLIQLSTPDQLKKLFQKFRGK